MLEFVKLVFNAKKLFEKFEFSCPRCDSSNTTKTDVILRDDGWVKVSLMCRECGPSEFRMRPSGLELT